VGEVSDVVPTADGISVKMAMKDDARIPLAAPFHIHNLTAVGEQYLDFEPESARGPYAHDGDTFHGTSDALPVDEGDLLVQLDQFVNSVDKKNLQIAVRELGDMFRDTGHPLETLLDNGTTFIDEAAAHEGDTRTLLERGLTVLHTQQQQGENIRALAKDLRLLTGSLRAADGNLRTVLQASPAALKEVNDLLVELGPTMPTLLGNLITDSSVVVTHLAGVEQLLVSFPRVVASGFSGTPANGWGRINLQTDNAVGPCRAGYLPISKWRRGDQVSDMEPFHARCASGPPYNMRGGNYAPADQPLPPARSWRDARQGEYDPATGRVYGARTNARLGDQGNLAIFGGDSWKWLVISPVMVT